MNRTALWRYILILLLVVIGTLYALPNIFGEDYAVQITRLSSVTSHVAPLDKQEFTKRITDILKKPTTAYPKGITPKRIVINTKTENGKTVVDGDPLLLFNDGAQQEAALVLFKKNLPQDKYSIAMSMAARTPQWLRAIGAKPMTLGLDLRGGIHFLLRVNIDSLMKNQFQNDEVDINNKLKPFDKPKDKIYFSAMCPPTLLNNRADRSSANAQCTSSPDTFTFVFTKQQYAKNPAARLSQFSNDYEINRDDKHNKISLKFKEQVKQQKINQAMTRNIQTLSSKINKLGVSEPTIQKQDKYNISVDLPGVQDVARARAAIGTVAKVELHLAEPDPKNPASALRIGKNDNCNPSSQFNRKVLDKEAGQAGAEAFLCLDPTIALPGRAIDNARAELDSQSGRPSVLIYASGAAVTQLQTITAKNQGRPLATLYMTTQDKTRTVELRGGDFTLKVDKDHLKTADSLISVWIDTINTEIRAQLKNEISANKPHVSYKKLNNNEYTLAIHGLDTFKATEDLKALKKLPEGFTLKKSVASTLKVKQTFSEQQQTVINAATIKDTLGARFNVTFGDGQMSQAKALAKQLRSGAYAAPVSFVAQQKLGPSMGKQNIQKGVFSCLIGSLLVILFMALYYRVFGLVANLALILNVVFVVALMSIIGATMTVPGIAGIILTVGMAVDANVLINERIREELRLGVSNQAAIKAGYDRAFSTIVDANVTTLLVACVLYGLGTGTVKGFAVTLTIGLVTSMFTSIFFTRAIINSIYGSRNVKHLSIGIKVK
jgi:protein-export membrane protein SecD